MKFYLRAVSLLPCMVLILGAAPFAHASTVSGLAFCDLETDSGGQGSGYAIDTPTIAQLSNAETTSAGQCASFTASAINFATGSDSTAATSPGVTGGDSLNNFLNYGGNLLTSSYTALAGANGAPATTATGSQDNDGTLLVLSGSTYLTNDESITLDHDDGALLYICSVATNCSLDADGNPIDASDYSLISPSGSGTQTVDGQPPFDFSGATGSYDFLLIDNANYEQPSDLQSNINLGAAPEPSSLTLLGTGLLAFAGLVRRRFVA